jgi:hypothetical protein
MTTKIKSGVIGDNVVGITQLNVSDGTNGQVLTTNGSGTLSFTDMTGGVDGIVSSADATAITIDSSENVGIGQISPATTLHIGDGASHYVRIENAGSGDVSSGYQIYRGSSVGMMLYDNPADNATSLLAAGKFNIITGGSGIDFNIDSSGNVGIGTTTPGHPLTVQATSATNPQLHFETSAYGNAYGTKILVASTNEAGTTSSFYNLYKTTGSVNGRSDVQQHLSFIGSAASSDYQYWSTGGSERMRIDGSGSLGLGTNNPGSLLHVAHSNGGVNPTARIENTTGTVATNSVLLDLKFSGDDSFSNCDYIKFQDYSGEEGVITGDGGGRVYYEITSDYRKKENIVDYTGGLDVINNLSVKNYNMITRPDITYTGFIAHEVQDVVGGVARGEKDAIDDEGNPIYQGLDMSKLVPHLVSAIQEQQIIIDDLKSRIEALEE